MIYGSACSSSGRAPRDVGMATEPRGHQHARSGITRDSHADIVLRVLSHTGDKPSV